MPAYTEKGTLEKGGLQKKGFSWQNEKGKAVLALRRDMTQVNSVKDEVRVYERTKLEGGVGWNLGKSRSRSISLDLVRPQLHSCLSAERAALRRTTQCEDAPVRTPIS